MKTTKPTEARIASAISASLSHSLRAIAELDEIIFHFEAAELDTEAVEQALSAVRIVRTLVRIHQSDLDASRVTA